MQYNASQRLDRLPESSFHRRLAALIGAGLFFDAFDLYMASGIMVALASEGWGTMQSNGQFVSAGALGALVGAGLAGWLGDRYGRRFAFQFNLVLFGLMSLAGALAPSMGWLIVFRLLMGIGLGAEIVVGYSTISEFVPPASRGKWGAVLFFCATAALLGSSVVSYWVIPTLGWRWMFGIAGIGGLLVWFLRKELPESPRWLESVGRHQEADAILRRVEAVAEREHGRLPEPGKAVERPVSLYRFRDLFHGRLLRSTVLAVVMNVVGLCAIYGFIIWLPTFLVKRGLSVTSSLGHTALMTAGSLLGILVGGYLSDKFPRRRLLIWNSVLGAGLGMLYTNMPTLGGTTSIGFLLMASLYFAGTIGFSTYIPELFPTELRLRGTGLASAAGRGASILAPMAAASLYEMNGVQGVTLTLTLMTAIQAAVIAWLGIETTQRSVDQAFRADSADH
ncbi:MULTISPECIES: MFS transporter [Cupriavidus]